MPPKKVPYFKPGKELKELINKDGLPAWSGTEPSSDVPPELL